MSEDLHTAWRGMDLVVTRRNQELDRIAADDIRRAIVVYRGAGDTPGDLVFALLEGPENFLLLPAHSGIGGRIHFERQAWWEGRRNVFWVPQSRAPLPRGARLGGGLGGWLFGRGPTGCQRVPLDRLAPLVEQWPLEGPQTWDQRKWQRIERSRPLAMQVPGEGATRHGIK